jgi:hypothetical protein
MRRILRAILARLEIQLGGKYLALARGSAVDFFGLVPEDMYCFWSVGAAPLGDMVPLGIWFAAVLKVLELRCPGDILVILERKQRSSCFSDNLHVEPKYGNSLQDINFS